MRISPRLASVAIVSLALLTSSGYITVVTAQRVRSIEAQILSETVPAIEALQTVRAAGLRFTTLATAQHRQDFEAAMTQLRAQRLDERRDSPRVQRRHRRRATNFRCSESGAGGSRPCG
jgi:hypothetical protein